MPRPNGIFKKSNPYQDILSAEFFEKTPKSVFAALAVSYLLNHRSVNMENIELDLKSEWRNLFEQGLVPQKPLK